MLRFLAAVLSPALVLSLAAPAIADPISGPVRVIDGDTIDVGEVRVRLHGIDAAEDDQTCETAAGKPWPCGEWVTARVRELFEGRDALCERVDTDRYGRAVARCAVDLGDAEGLRGIAEAKDGPGGAFPWTDMGAAIVGRGLAVAYLRYSDDYAEVEARARAEGAGVFAGTMASPAAHRAGASGRAAPDPACPIKGNVSENGASSTRPAGRSTAARRSTRSAASAGSARRRRRGRRAGAPRCARPRRGPPPRARTQARRPSPRRASASGA